MNIVIFTFEETIADFVSRTNAASSAERDVRAQYERIMSDAAGKEALKVTGLDPETGLREPGYVLPLDNFFDAMEASQAFRDLIAAERCFVVVQGQRHPRAYLYSANASGDLKLVAFIGFFGPIDGAPAPGEGWTYYKGQYYVTRDRPITSGRAWERHRAGQRRRINAGA